MLEILTKSMDRNNCWKRLIRVKDVYVLKKALNLKKSKLNESIVKTIRYGSMGGDTGC